MRIFFTLLNLHTHTTMNQFAPLTKLGFRSFLIPKSVVFNQQFVRSSSRVCSLAFQPPTAYKFSTTMASSTKPRSISSPKHKITASKENDIKARKIDIDSVEVDLDGIENMSVVELKQKLRSLGIPAKGRKTELVDALRGSLSYNSDDSNYLIIEDSPDNKPNHPKKISKRKIEGSPTQIEAKYVNTAVSRISEAKRTKKVVDHAPAEETIKEVKTMLLAKKQETSVRSNKATVSKLRGGKGEVAAQVVSGAAEASKMADPLETQCEPWTVLTHTKPQKGWIPYNPRTMRQPPLTADTKHVKIMSWNVNGLRALLKVEGFSQLAQREDFDVLCLQETKLQDKDVEAIKRSLLEGYEDSFWTCSVTKLGYSGTAIISRIKPLSVRYGLGISDHDSEGRLVTVEYDTFYLLSGYVPNSGDGLRRLSYRVTEWDPSLSNYMKELEKAKPVILTGDLNCAHEEIDIYNPAGNKRSAGFTIEERQSFETNFLNRGFVDTFRNQHPSVIGYTYWGYRHNGRKTNKGWRLDYFLVSESIANKAYDSYILPDVGGSDHSPIGLILTL